MPDLIKFLLFCFPFMGTAQVVDFENLSNLEPGDPVGVISLAEEDYEIQFYIGHDITDTIPLQIQKVAFNSWSGGFYGAESNLDCERKTIPPERINQINSKNFVLNPSLTNRERVGCHFISGVLKGEVLPSIFIFYNKPVMGCSADLLDVDGHDNTIEAYDIYCYATPADYPLKPVNNNPIEIRAVGRTYGHGILGDNGGVMPFDIDFAVGFTLIEIRPIQQVSGGNTVRNEFGFALDNYSPKSVEEAPYIPPYMTGEDNQVSVSGVEDKKLIIDFTPSEKVDNGALARGKSTAIESIYFDFDESNISKNAEAILKKIIEEVTTLTSGREKITLQLSGFTDPSGDENYNVKLSAKRVNAAAAYLIKHGVDPSLIKKSHHGEEYSGAANDSDAKKRTVQIHLNYQKI